MKAQFSGALQRRPKRRRNLKLDLDALAADPEVAKVWLFQNAGEVLDTIRADRSQAVTAEDLRVMLAAELEKARAGAATDLRLPTWSEVEEAIPGPMTAQEFQAVLAGGKRKRRSG